MAILKATYDNETDIPAEATALELYEERDGKYILKRDAIDGMKTEADIQRVQAVVTKQKGELKTVKAIVTKLGNREIDDVLKDLDKVSSLEAEVEALKDDGKNSALFDKRVEAMVATRMAPHDRKLVEMTTERDTLTETNKGLSGTINTDRIAQSLRAAALKAGVAPTALDDALMLGERHFERDDEGRVVTKESVGVTPGVEADVWLSEIKERKPHWWPVSAGGGATGGNGKGTAGAGNPYTSEGWNRTNQNALPADKANQMARAAGFEDAAAAVVAGAPIPKT